MARLTTFVVRCAALAVLVLCLNAAHADASRAKVNYMLQCQGCHMPDARGADKVVPRLREFMGFYTHSREGREFLIRVPGVATSSLASEELAELLNWMLHTFSAAQLPADFKPYTASEVARFRVNPDRDPLANRIPILDRLALDLPALQHVLKAGDYAY